VAAFLAIEILLKNVFGPLLNSMEKRHVVFLGYDYDCIISCDMFVFNGKNFDYD
jgi:hypothetical protein